MASSGVPVSCAGRPVGWPRWQAVAGVLLLAMALIGCSRSGPPEDHGDVQVKDITLGRALAPDGSIVPDTQTNSFWVSDTFYVSVATTGSAPNVRLTVRWINNDGKVVSETTKTIGPQGPTTTAFEAVPSEPWPAGDYKVEVFLNDVSVGTRDLSARS